MTGVNPAYIPRNHRVSHDGAAVDRDDFGRFEELLSVLSRPYEDSPDFAYAEPPAPDERVRWTFCGT
jgi:protein adenylyltransferase